MPISMKKLRKIRIIAFEEYPRVYQDLTYKPVSATHCIVKDARGERYFKLSSNVARIMQRLDGTRSLATLSYELKVQPHALRYVLDQLARLQLLETGSNKEKPATKPARLPAILRWGAKLILIRKTLIRSDHWMDSVYRGLHLKAFFRLWLLIVLALIYLSAFAIYLHYSSLLNGQIADIFTLRHNFFVYIPLILVMSLGAGVLHELAHGFVCKHFHGRIYALGVGLYYLQPVFYCDVSDVYTFPKRSQRVLTHAAGILMNLLQASLALLLLPLAIHIHWMVEAITGVFLFVGVYSLFNFNPLIKLDGYYILGDLLGIENVREKAFNLLISALHTLLQHLHLVKPLLSLHALRYSRLEKSILLLYALLSLAYTSVLLWYMGSAWGRLLPPSMRGWAWLLSIALMIVLFLGPLWQQWRLHAQQMRKLQHYLHLSYKEE